MVRNDIVNDIVAHVEKSGGAYLDWYCGIAADPKKRLFSDHNVSEKHGHWIYKNADSEASARDTEQYLLKFGFDGGDGGGDYATKHVYAYRKTSSTVE